MYEVVSKINDKINDKRENNYVVNCNLEITTDGYNIDIMFFGNVLFGEDYDDREYFEYNDTYETFDEYLTRKCNETMKIISETINKIKL